MEPTIQVKERPILFSGAMVKALLAGNKTQTRRLVKPARGMQADWLKPETLASSPSAYVCFTEPWQVFGAQFEHPGGGPLTHIPCPYGKPGDRLWVRETLFFSFCDEGWCYQADNEPVWVDRPDDVFTAPILYGNKPAIPSIHMPREVCRILLEVESVRVERLQDITRSDIRAEGLACPQELCSDEVSPNYKEWYPEAWRALWESINGAGSWAKNNWVWVVAFKVVQP